MKKLYMFVTSWCPHCKNAKKWLKELQEENPEFQKINLEIIDEEEQSSRVEELNLDYYYVPTFYLEQEKLYEGIPSKKIVKEVLEKSLAH